MLKSLHKNLLVYANSRWGRRIFVWSSVAIFVGAIAYVSILGAGSETNSGAASEKFQVILAAVIAVPALIVFNLAVALLWAIGATITGAFRG